MTELIADPDFLREYLEPLALSGPFTTAPHGGYEGMHGRVLVHISDELATALEDMQLARREGRRLVATNALADRLGLRRIR